MPALSIPKFCGLYNAGFRRLGYSTVEQPRAGVGIFSAAEVEELDAPAPHYMREPFLTYSATESNFPEPHWSLKPYLERSKGRSSHTEPELPKGPVETPTLTSRKENRRKQVQQLFAMEPELRESHQYRQLVQYLLSTQKAWLRPLTYTFPCDSSPHIESQKRQKLKYDTPISLRTLAAMSISILRGEKPRFERSVSKTAEFLAFKRRCNDVPIIEALPQLPPKRKKNAAPVIDPRDLLPAPSS